MRVLITGTAGFIGFHGAMKFLDEGHTVLGLDNINDYYSPQLKLDRLAHMGIEGVSDNKLIASSKYTEYSFVKTDIANQADLEKAWGEFEPELVVHLAAQAGVRYSMENPHAYTKSNLVGFMNMIELARQSEIKHFIYASSSSVYGLNKKMPFEETDPVDHPASLYAASKRANELIAHSYSNLYSLPTTGLRFFTVYGPWGRPDMFIYKIAEAIRFQKPIDLYMRGEESLWRDYTYVTDIVSGIYELSNKPVETKNSLENPNSSTSPFAIFNIGNNAPVENIKIVAAIEKELGIEAIKNFTEAPKTEPFKTFASTDALTSYTGYKPSTGYEEGIAQFIKWYKEYNGV